MTKPKETIIIVEDNDLFGKALYDTVKNTFSEYDIFLFPSAVNVVEAIEEGLKPICGLIDIILPDSHGTFLAKHIFSSQPEAKLIAMTGFIGSELINEALRLGFLDCLLKPFKDNIAIQIIEQALDRYAISKRKTLLIQDIRMMMDSGQSFQFSSIFSLVTTLEKQSAILKNVSLQITELALKIGNMLKLSENDIKILRYTALLYDMGKIIEEEQKDKDKQDSITTTSFTIFKIILFIIRNIHEWYDGTGFPNQIKGENIPLFSRVIAVAQGYVNLTIDRFHQKSLSSEEALSEIQHYSGSQYDPAVVEALTKIIKRAKKI